MQRLARTGAHLPYQIWSTAWHSQLASSLSPAHQHAPSQKRSNTTLTPAVMKRSRQLHQQSQKRLRAVFRVACLSIRQLLVPSKPCWLALQLNQVQPVKHCLCARVLSQHMAKLLHAVYLLCCSFKPPLPVKDAVPHSRRGSSSRQPFDMIEVHLGISRKVFAPSACTTLLAGAHSGQENRRLQLSEPECKKEVILAPGVLVTLEPLPFANAEGPLKLLAPDCSPAPSADPTGHLGEAQVPSALTGLHAHSPSKSTAAPGDTLCCPADTMLSRRACQIEGDSVLLRRYLSLWL